MSKAVAKGAHWMPRTSSYSLHGQRNGRVDILPPNAQLPTYGDLRDRYEVWKGRYVAAAEVYRKSKEALQCNHAFMRIPKELRNDHAVLEARLPSSVMRMVDQHAANTNEMNSARARLEDYKQIFLDAKNEWYERTWIATAKAMLPHDVVNQIESVVAANRRDAEGYSAQGKLAE